jgi:hypothetical protein
MHEAGTGLGDAYAQWPVQPRTFANVPAPWPDAGD